MNKVTSASPMTRGGFVCTAEAAGSIATVGAEFGIVIVAAEHMLSGVQQMRCSICFGR
jgi:hypothetical protein